MFWKNTPTFFGSIFWSCNFFSYFWNPHMHKWTLARPSNTWNIIDSYIYTNNFEIFFRKIFAVALTEVFYKKDVSQKKKNAKFTRKYLCRRLFFLKKVAGLKSKDSETSISSVHFAKFLRAPYLQNTSERLLLLFSRKRCK